MSNDTAGSCYPLQEVLRTAFPDLKFTTMQVMNMQDDLARRFGQVIERRQADSSPTPAPAPMTAANPGNQSLGPSRYIEVDREKYDALTARVAERERNAAQTEAKLYDASVQEWKDRAQAAEVKLLDWLLAIAGGRRASIGSPDNTYCPQLSRERVDAEIRALQTHVLRMGHD